MPEGDLTRFSRFTKARKLLLSARKLYNQIGAMRNDTMNLKSDQAIFCDVFYRNLGGIIEHLHNFSIPPGNYVFSTLLIDLSAFF